MRKFVACLLFCMAFVLAWDLSWAATTVTFEPSDASLYVKPNTTAAATLATTDTTTTVQVAGVGTSMTQISVRWKITNLFAWQVGSVYTVNFILAAPADGSSYSVRLMDGQQNKDLCVDSPFSTVTANGTVVTTTFTLNEITTDMILSFNYGLSGIGAYTLTEVQMTDPTDTPSPLPTLSFSAAATVVNYNTATTLTWSSTDATSCMATGDWSGEKGTNGSESTGNLVANKTYTLECTGPGGTTGPQSVIVTVTSQPPVGETTTVLASVIGDELYRLAKDTSGNITAETIDLATLALTASVSLGATTDIFTSLEVDPATTSCLVSFKEVSTSKPGASLVNYLSGEVVRAVASKAGTLVAQFWDKDNARVLQVIQDNGSWWIDILSVEDGTIQTVSGKPVTIEAAFGNLIDTLGGVIGQVLAIQTGSKVEVYKVDSITFGTVLTPVSKGTLAKATLSEITGTFTGSNVISQAKGTFFRTLKPVKK